MMLTDAMSSAAAHRLRRAEPATTQPDHARAIEMLREAADVDQYAIIRATGVGVTSTSLWSSGRRHPGHHSAALNRLYRAHLLPHELDACGIPDSEIDTNRVDYGLLGAMLIRLPAITVTSLSKCLGVSSSAVSAWLDGRQPKYPEALRLIEYARERLDDEQLRRCRVEARS